MSNVASNKLGNNGGRAYSFLNRPVTIDCNFIVDSTNGNGLGLRSLKGSGVQAVYMNTSNGAGLPMATSRQYGLLAATAITNTGNTAITGSVGEYPGTAITPGTGTFTVSGATNIANIAAQNAQSDALAAFTAGQTAGLAGTTIASELGGQTLTPGAYQFASGTAGLSLTSGHSTLTFNGAGTYIIYTATTLLTGATGSTDLPTMVFSGGATPSNVYWIVGTSATINQAAASAGAVFQGNVIAHTSITATQAGSINGTLAALTGAITLSAGQTIVTQAVTPAFTAAGSPNPAPGYALIQLANNYNRYAGGFSGFVSPTTGTNVAINSTALTVGSPYIIVSTGHATAGAVTIAPVADSSGSLASTYFSIYDAYANRYNVWFSVDGVGAAPQNVAGIPVQQSIHQNDSAATIGADLVITLENLLAAQPGNVTAPAGVYSFTAAGTSTVTVTSTATNPYGPLPGGPQDGALTPTGFTFAVTKYNTNGDNWRAVGLPQGVAASVGASFIATSTGSSVGGGSTGLVQAPSVSGINSIEVVGDPNASLSPVPRGGSPNVGGWVLVQFLSNGVPAAPKDGSVCGMTFVVEAASITIKGE
jgi:hypothetical protein